MSDPTGAAPARESADGHGGPTVLLTGAAGRMGRTLRTPLSAAFDTVRLFSRRPLSPLAAGEQVAIGDLSDAAAVFAACQGVDVIVHLGGKADEATFQEILNSNIVGTYNVFEGAKRAGVRRVVYASSHHVTGFYPVENLTTVDSPVRPDTYYGVSKVFGEALGRLYHDKWGLEVVCLRIGVCRVEPENSDQLRTWLSVEDSVRLVKSAATCELPDGIATVYGVSDNARRFWDSDAGAKIGFFPEDSADSFANLFAEGAGFSYPWQGGAFTGVDYVGGIW
jgi:uronate dehydrogenase